MATSDAQLVNLALVRVGIRELIDSLDEDSVNAQAANAVYGLVRDALLARVPWPFARRRATLGLLTDVTRDGWLYAYALPSDCIQALYIYPGLRAPRASQRVPFGLELEGDTRILLTDQASPVLCYTARVTSPGLFPPLFADALAWGLAVELALVLPMERTLAQGARSLFELTLAQAAVAARNEEQPDPPPESEFIAERS
jgi:hypothetical protein